MKLLVLTDNLDEHCGWGRYSWGIISRLIGRKNFEVKVLVNKLSGKNTEEKFFKNSYNYFDYIRIILKLRKFIKNSDVVHCFDGFPYAIFAYLAGVGLNKKIIVNGVGTYSALYLVKGWKGVFLRKSYKKAFSILCISNYTKRRILEIIPKLKNIKTVYLGVEAEKFNSAPREEIKDNPVIISVGAFKRRKGHHISIEAINILSKKYSNLSLYIIGGKDDKEYYNYLNGLVKKFNLDQKVFFYSDISDTNLVGLYKSADIFLMPAVTEDFIFEGFGLVYIEANACGLPAIGTYNCGAEDAIKNGYNGYLVEQNNPRAVANKIDNLFSNNVLYKNISKNSIKWAKKFNWDKTVNLYIKEYKR